MERLEKKELMNINGGFVITKGALLVLGATALGFVGGCTAAMTE